MENKTRELLFWEKLKTAMLGCILLAMVLLTVVTWSAVRSVRRYESTVINIVERLDAITRELSELDVEAIVSTANETTAALQEADIPEMVRSLREISSQLEQADLAGLARDVDDLVIRAQESLAQAEEALASAENTFDTLDVEALNQAISDLKDVIEPLASFVNKFR